ncbi:MAG TPA: hypothetical protein VEU08_10375 [Vicinamibacterales bacterium]|nr:hypothetical protein [Vicinamibacterales bacterium]
MRARLVLVALIAAALSCSSNPNAPQAGPLADGKWSGGGACLTVADTCDMTVGCGHGVFPRPAIRDDGTFDVDGTYRIEIGPVSTGPPPAAHFHGAVAGSTLTLTLSSATLPAVTYTMQMNAAATCGIRCL